MLHAIITYIGVYLILTATEIGRKEDSKLHVFSYEYLKQILLILIGLLLIVLNK